jgi:hypothetical protein
MQDLHTSPEYKEIVATFHAMDFTSKPLYGSWLMQTYYYVCHSTRLLAMAGSRFAVDDPLGKRMFEHVGEERGHEVLALRDARALGYGPEDFPRLRMTELFYQNQYYRIILEQPSDFLGYVYLLEGLGVEICPWLHQVTQRAHGDEASTFIKVHAHADQDHIVKARHAIEGLSPAQQQGVIDDFFQAAETYLLILKGVQRVGNERALRA